MKRFLLITLCLTLLMPVRAQDIVFNRAPLADDAFAELPLGAIKPQGWLLDQLQRQRDGMTGHLDSLYAPVVGDNNAWIGGDGDTWERGPYWIDGLLPLAYILPKFWQLDGVWYSMPASDMAAFLATIPILVWYLRKLKAYGKSNHH